MRLVKLRWVREQKVDQRLPTYEIADKDDGEQRQMEKLLARYGAICIQARSARIHAVHIQKTIIRECDILIKYLGSRGSRYIDALKSQREYCNWILAQKVNCNGEIADFESTWDVDIRDMTMRLAVARIMMKCLHDTIRFEWRE